MNLKFPKVLFALFILLLAVSCNNDDETKKNIKEMWPLDEGNYWSYQMESGQEDKMFIEVKSSAQDKEKGEYYQVEFDFGTHQTYEYYSYDEKGLLWFQLDNPWGSYKRVPPEYLIKKPPNESQNWQWQGQLETITGSDLNYKGKGKISQRDFMKIELPTGSYNALKIEKNMTLQMTGERIEVKDIRYYVPGIGLVKQEVYENGHEQLIIKLEDYEVDDNRLKSEGNV